MIAMIMVVAEHFMNLGLSIWTFFVSMSHMMMTGCRCFQQDALRVAVALWALSDGKALSLRLLVGALEGLVAQLKDHRCWQTAW